MLICLPAQLLDKVHLHIQGKGHDVSLWCFDPARASANLRFQLHTPAGFGIQSTSVAFL